MHRRSFLAAMTAAALAMAAPALCEARARRRRVREIATDDGGATLALELEASPFPHPSGPYTDATTLVFVPKHFRLPASGRVDAVVHFHGHSTTAALAMRGHALREQLRESKQNAVLVMPQLGVAAADGSPGKLGDQGGLARLLEDVLRVLAGPAARDALEDTGIGGRRPRLGMACVSAHSGGYRAAASCLRKGGVEVSEVYLFDALYGEADAFRDWVLERKDERGRRRHKLVCHHAGGRVRAKSLALAAELEARGVRCDREDRPGELSRERLVSGRAIFIASATSHSGATWEQNALRDCLFASGLRRQLGSRWFDDKELPRRIDARG